MHSKEEFRDLIRQRIHDENWTELFIGGACYFFALILHEELHLPLFYASPADRDEFRHVFVMQGRQCIDYLGRRPVEIVAGLYAEWPDVPPRPTTTGEVMSRIREKGFGDDLEKQLWSLARTQFQLRREKYS